MTAEHPGVLHAFIARGFLSASTTAIAEISGFMKKASLAG
jgi:hypothetical protein